VLAAAKTADSAKVVFIASEPSVEQAVAAMKAGAFDYLVQPIEDQQLQLLVSKAFDLETDAAAVCAPCGRPLRIVTRSRAMQALLARLRQVADSRASILIQGESGTGKELLARFIHEHSSRRQQPFVAVNCGALPESLLESELFGYEKGAFTGAASRKPGRFELAHGGTILLDEVTEMQVYLQAKLLRVLQEREVDRVGGIRPVPVDVRVLATTNRDIRDALEKGDFREDLYYRLNVIPLVVPPLRERPEDIEVLADHFIEKYNEIDGRNVKTLAGEARLALMAHLFPGNVRELENIIERAVLMCDGQTIREADLFLDASAGTGCEPVGLSDSLMPAPLKEVERKLIFHTLDRTNGNRTHAAKMLGISVRTLRNKLNEYKETMG
jgi:DNA-binding NtrC family response regulator